MLYLIKRCNLWNTPRPPRFVIDCPLQARASRTRCLRGKWCNSNLGKGATPAACRILRNCSGWSYCSRAPCGGGATQIREEGGKRDLIFLRPLNCYKLLPWNIAMSILSMFPWPKTEMNDLRNISSDKIWRQRGKGGRMSDNSWPPGRPVEFPCGPEWVTRRHLSSCIHTSLALVDWSLTSPNLFVRNRVSQCMRIKSIWS